MGILQAQNQNTKATVLSANSGKTDLSKSVDDHLYSVGATAIIDALHILAKDYRSPTWDIFLINTATLIRNNLNKELTNQQVVKGTFEDMDNIVHAFKDYLFSRPRPPVNPKIIIYLPDYSALPLIHRRPLNATSTRILAIQDEMTRKYVKDKLTPEVVNFQGIDCVTMCAGNNRIFPHRVLYQYIKDEHSKSTMKSLARVLGFDQTRVGILSHCAIDLHLSFLVKVFNLMESYTGNIKELSQFGEKIFKLPFIPFNRATHLLFGDSTHIKPIAVRKNKQLILDIAKKNKWFAKTEESIISDVARTGLLPKEFLTTVKF